MKEYHINLNGKVVECKYGSKECNFGEHYENRKLAEENLQSHLEKQFGLFQEDNEMIELIDKMYITISNLDEYIDTHSDEYINIQLEHFKELLGISIGAIIDGSVNDEGVEILTEDNIAINEAIIRLKCEYD